MAFVVDNITETRWSWKIILGKARKSFPKIYDACIYVRFLTFKKSCNKNSLPILKYSDGSWVNRKTTKDLLRIQNYILQDERELTVLQIGTGNSSFYMNARSHLKKLVSITIVQEEIEYAKQISSSDFGNMYKVKFENKYSGDLSALGGSFDYIIDNDLSSYACCKKHFFEMLSEYKKILAKEGCILIGLDGLRYFDSGFGLTEKLANSIFNHLGFEINKNNFCYVIKINKNNHIE
jgi:hypothetical protein